MRRGMTSEPVAADIAGFLLRSLYGSFPKLGVPF